MFIIQMVHVVVVSSVIHIRVLNTPSHEYVAMTGVVSIFVALVGPPACPTAQLGMVLGTLAAVVPMKTGSIYLRVMRFFKGGFIFIGFVVYSVFFMVLLFLAIREKLPALLHVMSVLRPCRLYKWKANESIIEDLQAFAGILFM